MRCKGRGGGGRPTLQVLRLRGGGAPGWDSRNLTTFREIESKEVVWGREERKGDCIRMKEDQSA